MNHEAYVVIVGTLFIYFSVASLFCITQYKKARPVLKLDALDRHAAQNPDMKFFIPKK